MAELPDMSYGRKFSHTLPHEDTRTRKTHQHPNLDLGGNRVLGTVTIALLLRSTLSWASGSEKSRYLGAILGNRDLALFTTFFGFDIEALRVPCICKTAAVIGRFPLASITCQFKVVEPCVVCTFELQSCRSLVWKVPLMSQ